MEDVASGQRGVEKKTRKRMKDVRKMILKQMEFYFSDSNLHKDRFIKKEMEKSKEGYVDLSIFLNFNRIKALTQDVKVLARALAKSTFLQVGEDNNTVRRTTPLKDPKNTDRRTVYIECLPRTATHEWVQKTFSQCGEVAYVSLPRYHTTGDLKGFGFVEFLTDDGADKACELLNNPPPDSTARAGKFPKSNKTLNSLQKKTGMQVDVEDVKVEVSTDDGVPSKACKKHRKRRRCASESSVDFVKEGLQILKKRKIDSPEVKSVKTELGYEAPTGCDIYIKQEYDSQDDDVKTSADQTRDDEDKKEVKRKKRKRQRLSDTSKSQDEDLPTAEFTLGTVKKEKVYDSDDKTVKKEKVYDSNDKTVKKEKVYDSNDKTVKKEKVYDSNDKTVKKEKVNDSNDKTVKKEKVNDSDDKTNESGKGSGSEQDGEKKGSKKRKTSNGDISVETLPSKAEHTPAKQGTRLSEKKDVSDSSVSQSKMVSIDTSANVEISGQVPNVRPHKKEKRRRKKKHKEKDVSLPQLRVIPKKEWLSLRKEYLSLQKQSMAMLKQKLKEIKTDHKPDGTGSVKKNQAVNDKSEMRAVKSIKKIEFQPGVIIQVSTKEATNRKKVKDQLAPDIQVAYIDVLDGAVDGYIRCENHQSANRLANIKNAEYNFTLLSGDKETAYWSKLTSDQEAKLNTKNRSKKRGVQKLIDKAHKHNSETMERKHIMFED
ncbi:la-related protein 7-like [Gigantopelta aegis]|uniref:la-related protein 7-like n=1 Tax=Gigantopelta aegis TaxID=1735272 RepID=UPI001B887F18|nr:la-related protein 7-like [Gigantopelta aegis]XP_041363126.1 la-related protein 7-like [Gigantopelta aegis]XP_041363127.1 la-related protein 7-like [Gigantopelta aegis]